MDNKGIDKEADGGSKEQSRFFDHRYGVLVRYCYSFYDGGEGFVYEKKCGYRSLSDAVKALEKRVRELESSGASCRLVHGDDIGGAPVLSASFLLDVAVTLGLSSLLAELI